MQSSSAQPQRYPILKHEFVSYWLWTLAALAKTHERLMSLPAAIAFRAMNLPLRTNSPFLNPEPPPFARTDEYARLDATGETIVEALQLDGYHLTTIAELAVPGSVGMIQSATHLSQQLLQRNWPPSPLDHPILSTVAEDVMKCPDLFVWGLENQLLNIVEAYIGARCGYGGLALTLSRADGREMSTRVWHRDREDRRMIKIIVYLGDVGEHDGPFEVLRMQAQKILDAALPWRYAKFKDAHLNKILGKNGATKATHSFTGKKGSVIFVDTARCHHRGKPPVRLDRSALFYTYFPQTPRHPFYCEQTRLKPENIRELGNQMPLRQRTCMLWRDSLPLLARLVPRNRMTV